MAYNPQPTVRDSFKTKLIDFATMQKLAAIRRALGLRGQKRQLQSKPAVLWSAAGVRSTRRSGTRLLQFLRWSEWLHERAGRGDGIALVRLMNGCLNS